MNIYRDVGGRFKRAHGLGGFTVIVVIHKGNGVGHARVGGDVPYRHEAEGAATQVSVQEVCVKAQGRRLCAGFDHPARGYTTSGDDQVEVPVTVKVSEGSVIDRGKANASVNFKRRHSGEVPAAKVAAQVAGRAVKYI